MVHVAVYMSTSKREYSLLLISGVVCIDIFHVAIVLGDMLFFGTVKDDTIIYNSVNFYHNFYFLGVDLSIKFD